MQYVLVYLYHMNACMYLICAGHQPLICNLVKLTCKNKCTLKANESTLYIWLCVCCHSSSLL